MSRGKRSWRIPRGCGKRIPNGGVGFLPFDGPLLDWARPELSRTSLEISP